ncbi:MAG TPA: sialidase family protein [Thermoanaerobaculia bacterium]|nr:sialidase family protein [Thermoanaerobaculia bacterium]
MSRRILLFALLVFTPASFLAAADRLTVAPLFSLTYPPPRLALADDGAIAITDDFVFFGTDGGLFRAPLPLGSAPPERVAFEWTPVTALAWSDGALYATLDLDHKTGPGGATHSLMKSLDDGATWQPLDAQLEECHGTLCERLLATQVEVIVDRLFVNAGGNVLVSGDHGASWSILQGASSTGKPQEQACYDPAFELVGPRLLIGGECPLDSAYLRTGTLAADRLQWQEEPVAAQTPFLENRNIQFIRRRGDSNLVYAGIEGALLRSTDAGASYEFILHYDHDAPKYPYITHILFPSTHPSAIVIAGFDKARGGPYLAVSFDDGATWRDESALLPGFSSMHWSVSALAQTPAGQMLIAVEDDDAGALHVAELRVTDRPSRRRAVRH